MNWSKTLTWEVEFDERARKELRKLRVSAQQEILSYLRKRVAVEDDLRRFGKPLLGNKFRNLWHYRVGDYRLICQIEDGHFIVLVVKVGHRRDAYGE